MAKVIVAKVAMEIHGATRQECESEAEMWRSHFSDEFGGITVTEGRRAWIKTGKKGRPVGLRVQFSGSHG